MESIDDILADLSGSALKLRAAFEYADVHPEDPHAGDDIDYSRDYVIDTIHRFNQWNEK